MMRDTAKEAVKAAATGDALVRIVEALGGTRVSRARNGECRTPCIIHGGKGPNLCISINKGLWHCKACDARGDVFGLVQQARGVSFLEARQWLASFLGIRLDDTERAHEARPMVPRVSVSTWRPPAVDVAAGFMRDLWATVAEAPWSAPTSRWLSDVRGIEPDAAYLTGCRDWSAVRHEVAALANAQPDEVLEAAGWLREGRAHMAVRGVMRGEPLVAVPVWRRGDAFPVRWRWRWISPPQGVAKSVQPYACGVATDLLGVAVPPPLEGAVCRMARLGDGTPGARIAVLVEGEPDWWSSIEALDGRAVVLGVCGSPSEWRREWPRMRDLRRDGVERVVVCVHRGEARNGLGHGEVFARAVAAECSAAGLGTPVRRLPAEGRDLADIHKAGELVGWFDRVLSAGR